MLKKKKNKLKKCKVKKRNEKEHGGPVSLERTGCLPGNRDGSLEAHVKFGI